MEEYDLPNGNHAAEKASSSAAEPILIIVPGEGDERLVAPELLDHNNGAHNIEVTSFVYNMFDVTFVCFIASQNILESPQIDDSSCSHSKEEVVELHPGVVMNKALHEKYLRDNDSVYVNCLFTVFFSKYELENGSVTGGKCNALKNQEVK